MFPKESTFIGRETRAPLQPLLKFYFLTFKLHNNAEHFGKCKQIRGKFKKFVMLPLPGEMVSVENMNMQIYFGVLRCFLLCCYPNNQELFCPFSQHSSTSLS